jgi:hypothetical protein
MIAFVHPTLACDAVFDPQPWIADLFQVRQSLSEKYANFEWAVFEREIDLSELFASTEQRILKAGSDAEARAAIDHLTSTLDDGHVLVEWPARKTSPTPAREMDFPSICASLGYKRKQC